MGVNRVLSKAKSTARERTNQGQDRTGQRGRSDVRQEKVGRKQPSCTQKGKTAGQEREKEVGREEKREGGR